MFAVWAASRTAPWPQSSTVHARADPSPALGAGAPGPAGPPTRPLRAVARARCAGRISTTWTTHSPIAISPGLTDFFRRSGSGRSGALTGHSRFITAAARALALRPTIDHRPIDQWHRRPHFQRDSANYLELYETPICSSWDVSRMRNAGATTRAGGHLHHRPQHQLHQRLRRRLQVLRVLPPAQAQRGLRAELRADRRERSTSARPSVASRSCCRAGTIPTSRSSGTSTSCATSSATTRSTSTGSRPREVVFFGERFRMPVSEVVRELHGAGLDPHPGRRRRDPGRHACAERVATKKAQTEEWLGVQEEAHRQGMKTSVTMMYGLGESNADRIEHLFRVRELQARTGGFTAFICWPLQPEGRHDVALSAEDRRGDLPPHARDRPASCSTTCPTCSPPGSRWGTRSGRWRCASAPTTTAA